jgi:flagellar protein FliJ
MTDPRRFDALIQIARQREDAAAARLAEAAARQAATAQRLAELAGYEQDYLALEPSATGGAQALARHSAFLARLREAQVFQQQRTLDAQRAAETQRGLWLTAHHEVKKLHTLQAQAQQQQQAQQERRQQREQDDRTISQHRHRSPPGIAA